MLLLLLLLVVARIREVVLGRSGRGSRGEERRVERGDRARTVVAAVKVGRGRSDRWQEKW